MHRAGPGERGGASYGRRAVATAKGAAMQISGGEGLNTEAAVEIPLILIYKGQSGHIIALGQFPVVNSGQIFQ